MFPNLIIGLSAFFDMDLHRNDFVPDNALTDEDTVVNRTYKTPVIWSLSSISGGNKIDIHCTLNGKKSQVQDNSGQRKRQRDMIE